MAPSICHSTNLLCDLPKRVVMLECKKKNLPALRASLSVPRARGSIVALGLIFSAYI